MDIASYFEPIHLADFEPAQGLHAKRLGDVINFFRQESKFPDIEGADLAIIGVKEDRRTINNEGCAIAPDYVRNNLYRLFKGQPKINIVDLGNIKRGHTVEDTYFALSNVIAELLSMNILPIIIGGSQDLTYANYLAYEKLKQTINIVSIDSKFDLGESEKEIDAQSFLSKIILHQPNFLFNYTNIGYQSYFVDQEAIELMRKLYFDIYRLGKVKQNIEEAEPMVRNADMISVDISSIRQSDAPGNANASPNGFYGEEMCQIMRYAGYSDKLTSIGFYELNPTLDHQQQTSHLVAQMIWYFIDGFYDRKHEFPVKDEEDFIRYIVSIKDHKNEIVFLKSKKSDRWWMEANGSIDNKTKYGRHSLIPCSYSDYQTACKDDIPDRWWQAYQKLM